MRTSLIVLAAVTAAAALVAAEMASRPEIVAPHESLAAVEGTVERASWIEPVDLSLPIVVDNPFGDVHLRSSGPGGVLDVSVVLQQLGPEGSRLDLAVGVDSQALRVGVVRTAKPGTVEAPGDRSRADLALLLPDGAAVTVTTFAGSVESRGVQAALVITTSSGDITVRQKRGRLELSSDSGNVLAFLEPGASDAAERFETVTGDITVWLRGAADATVTLATSGAITTDFSLVIDHHDHAEPDKRARAVIGAGGRAITLTSRRGDLALRRLLPVAGG